MLPCSSRTTRSSFSSLPEEEREAEEVYGEGGVKEGVKKCEMFGEGRHVVGKGGILNSPLI